MMKPKLLTAAAVVVVTILTSLNCHADDWKVGLAQTDITPGQPIRLSGYASRKEPFKAVMLELNAKAMLVVDAAGNRGLIVTVDLVGLRASMAEPICEAISKQTGLIRPQILINWAHTHTGPALIDVDDDLDWPQDQIDASVAYTKWVTEKIISVGVEACKSPQPARLSWSVGVATFPMNRREFTEYGVKLGVNPSGLVDRSVPVLRVDSIDGKPLCVLFGTACHNTTLGPEHVHISGDFAGYSQQHVETALPGVQAMFMQNCGGDTNPHPRGEEAIAAHHGESLGEEVLRVIKTELQPIEGKLTTLLESIDVPLQPAPAQKDLEKLIDSGSWRRWVGEQIKKKVAASGSLPASYSMPIGLWQFGDDLTLVALPGEVVVGYVDLISQKIGPRKLWVSAYNNDEYGYLPTARILEEGGYETRGLYDGGIGFFSTDAEKVVVDKVGELAKKAGREVE